MSKVLVKNIKELFSVYEESPDRISGADMKKLPSIKNAWLAIENGLISDFGTMEDWPGISDWSGLEIIDADGKMVLPTFCDSHTHMVYAASREGEFVDRINGLSYAEIANRGGGILNSAAKLRNQSLEELYESSLKRINNAIALGTGALEIKSGYGLSKEGEIKMLEVIKMLKESCPIPIKSTFLGAHAVPPEFKGDSKKYVDHVIKEILPEVGERKLADYIDVFCEEGYFDLEDTINIIEAGSEYGLKAKIHANQFKIIGGIPAACERSAISVDHLEELDDNDIKALKNSSTFPVALPSCSFFLQIPYTPARKIIDAGLPLVLASDANPGSTPSFNLNFVLSLACIQQKLLPEEAINALCLNGAAAMELQDEVGSITPGKRANFIITKPMNSLAYMPYDFGQNNIESVFINGEKFN